MSGETMREVISKARQAQQENKQKHDVQLEIPDPRLNPQNDGYDYWREGMYLRGEDYREIYGPGNDCQPED